MSETYYKNQIEYSIYCAKQHIEVAKDSIKNGVDDLIDYSIRAAERKINEAEKILVSLCDPS